MAGSRPDRARGFALTVPGIGRLLATEAATAQLGPGPVEFDGRADIVSLRSMSRPHVAALRRAEDVFLAVASVRRVPSPAATAAAIHSEDLRSALRDRAALVGGRPPRTFRVIVRVRSERDFKRTELRDAVTRRVVAAGPGLRPVADRAEVEVWMLQTTASSFRVGLRLPFGSRAAEPRAFERPGALRPAVAAAMIGLAGQARGRLLDPCAGSGTILTEAATAGWRPVGGDIEPGAIVAARANTGAVVLRSDARTLPFAANTFPAVVTNLPFGERFRVPGSPIAWYRRVLAEAGRVAPTVIVLAPPSPPFRRALGRLPFDLDSRYDLVLLGQPTSIWALTRRSAGDRR